jgi:hypothetical protein
MKRCSSSRLWANAKGHVPKETSDETSATT